MRSVLFFVFWTLVHASFAQSIKVEYTKSRSLSSLHTFQIKGGEITTPKDQKRITDLTIHQWIQSSIQKELEYNGLKRIDTLADIVVTYVFGIYQRTNFETLGPLAQTPGRGIEDRYTYNYDQSTLIIDLNDRSGNLIWRISSTDNLTTPLSQKLIGGILDRGFRKFKKMQRPQK